MPDAPMISRLKHPLTGAPADVVDMRQRFASIAKAQPRNPQAEATFAAARRSRIMTNERLSAEEKAGLLARFRSISAAPNTGVAPAAIPPVAGTGYGFYFNDNFIDSFTTGTANINQIICPTFAGGAFEAVIYLTATNRTSLGLEAYVAYWTPTQPAEFHVFDWSLGSVDVNSGFVLNVPFAHLGEYFIGLGTHDQIFQTIFVHNATFQYAPNQWANQALLFNAVDGTWHFMYSSSYTATLAQQQDQSAIGFWGPIVEIHQTSNLRGTAPMGFFQTQISNLDANGNQLDLILLDPTNTHLVGPSNGIQPIFLNANFDWAVQS